MVNDDLNKLLELGFDVAAICCIPLAVLCLAGLVFMLVGHRFDIPGQMLINRIFFYIMVATVIFSVVFIGLGLYVNSNMHSYGLWVYMFGFMMIVPTGLSLLALLLRRCSPFPIDRARQPPL